MNILFLTYHPSMLSNWVVKLQPFLEDYNIYVLHIAKLHSVKVKPIKKIQLYDVSWNSYSRNKELLKQIKPELVVFLSFRSMWEHTFQRICKSLKFSQVYLEHGLYSKDTLSFKPNKLKTNFGNTIFRQIAFWYNEIGCIIHSEKIIDEIKLCRDVYFKGRFGACPFEHYFIYSQRSFDKYSQIYKMKIGVNTTLVGYPIFNDKSYKLLLNNSLCKNDGVLYVHQPLIKDGIAAISYEEEKKWLINIYECLKDRYSSFTILLHPRADLDAYIDRFKNTGINVIKSPNNYLQFAERSLIIGHYSTALLYGLYFNKPTVILDYPTTINDTSFAECFSYCKSIDELREVNLEVNYGAKKMYFVGDVNTFEHIAEKMKDYLRDKY